MIPSHPFPGIDADTASDAAFPALQVDSIDLLKRWPD